MTSVRRLRSTEVLNGCSELMLIFSLALAGNMIAKLPVPYNGFFCDDRTISYPIIKIMVNNLTLYTVICLVPTGIIIVHEVFISACERWKGQIAPQHALGSVKLSPLLCRIYYFVVRLYLAISADVVIRESTKHLVGDLKPYFMNGCVPDWQSIECYDDHGFLRYVENYVCTSTAPDALEKETHGQTGFPSGHASLSCLVFVLMAHYVRYRPQRCNRVIAHFLALGMFISAGFITVSTLTDHHHTKFQLAGGIPLGLAEGLFFSRWYGTSWAIMPEWLYVGGKREPDSDDED